MSNDGDIRILRARAHTLTHSLIRSHIHSHTYTKYRLDEAS